MHQHFNIEVTKSFSVKYFSDPFCRVVQTKFSRRLVILGLGSVADWEGYFVFWQCPCGAPFDESTRGCKGGPQNKSLFLTLMLQTPTNGNCVNNNPTFVIVDSPKWYQGKKSSNIICKILSGTENICSFVSQVNIKWADRGEVWRGRLLLTSYYVHNHQLMNSLVPAHLAGKDLFIRFEQSTNCSESTAPKRFRRVRGELTKPLRFETDSARLVQWIWAVYEYDFLGWSPSHIDTSSAPPRDLRPCGDAG